MHVPKYGKNNQNYRNHISTQNSLQQEKLKKNLTITIPLTYLFIFQYVNFQEYK